VAEDRVAALPEEPSGGPDRSDFLRADEAASVAHDFIWSKNGVTQKQASDAIWTIHNVLRPLIPLSALPDHDEIMAELKRLAKEGDRAD
jgi:hypothetical protein